MLYYTGIGSRSTPQNIQNLFQYIAVTLAYDGYVLRSGAAIGADTAFEYGCKMAYGPAEIYLPWRMFNNSPSRLWKIPDAAFEMAGTIHPNWNVLSHTDRKLHARNVMQVLGEDLQTPSTFVVCWTKHGKKIGGTRTAVVLAERHEIPVYNFGSCNIPDLLCRMARHFLKPTSKFEQTFQRFASSGLKNITY